MWGESQVQTTKPYPFTLSSNTSEYHWTWRSYRRHLESLCKKLTLWVTFLRQLAGGTMLALIHSTAEYCAPVAAVPTPVSLILSKCLHPTSADNLQHKVSQLGLSPSQRDHGAILLVPQAAAFTKWLCRDIAKPYWYAGGHSIDVFGRGPQTMKGWEPLLQRKISVCTNMLLTIMHLERACNCKWPLVFNKSFFIVVWACCYYPLRGCTRSQGRCWVLWSEIPSGMCAKLRTFAASNNRDHSRCHR